MGEPMTIGQAVRIKDERQRLRVNCNARVLVETGDRRVIRGRLRDVGLQSLYLFLDSDSEAFLIYGEKVQVKVTMQRDNSSLTIELDGNVTRMDDSGFVVQFSRSLRWWPVFIMFPRLPEN